MEPSPHSYSGVFLNQKSRAEERGAVDSHVRLNLEKNQKYPPNNSREEVNKMEIPNLTQRITPIG